MDDRSSGHNNAKNPLLQSQQNPLLDLNSNSDQSQSREAVDREGSQDSFEKNESRVQEEQSRIIERESPQTPGLVTQDTLRKLALASASQSSQKALPLPNPDGPVNLILPISQSPDVEGQQPEE